MLPILSTGHARGCGALGRIEEGLEILDEAEEIVERRGERWFEAELHCTRGDLLAAQAAGHGAEAEDCFRRALAVARSQEARSSELRAATGLARLLQEQQRHAEARETLRPVLEGFEEGFEVPDLLRAKAVLEASEGRPLRD